MSRRVDRARAQRLARLRKLGGSLIDEAAIELSLPKTIACIFFLLSLGASLATAYILYHVPGCLGASGNGSQEYLRTKGSTSAVSTDVANTATAPKVLSIADSTAPANSKPAPATTSLAADEINSKGFTIPQCTAQELSIIEKQLPSDNCVGSPFTQKCSFTLATAKVGCHDDSEYFRQPMASMNLKDTFTAVLIGLPDKDDTLMDLLSIGSHNPTKYNVQQFRNIVNKETCLRPEIKSFGSDAQKAQVFVLEPDTERAKKGKEWKDATGLTNDDLKGEIALISSKSKTLSLWADTQVPSTSIHYLRCQLPDGNDFDILSSGAGPNGVLHRVWYLDFGYHWKGDWASHSLKTLTSDILGNFACYWHGTGGNLWRISGCWKSHYDFHSWSRLVCVNTQILEAKPLVDKMEETFQATLKKSDISNK